MKFFTLIKKENEFLYYDRGIINFGMADSRKNN